MKVLEAAIVAAASAIILLLLIYVVPDCQPIRGYIPPPPENNTANLPEISNVTEYLEYHDIHKRAAGAGAAPVEEDDHHGHHSTNGSHHPPYGYDPHHHGYIIQVQFHCYYVNVMHIRKPSFIMSSSSGQIKYLSQARPFLSGDDV